ncbi:hypothetical protein D3C83_10100 [compost metagenome]
MEILHESRYFLNRSFGQGVQFRLDLGGDVMPVDGVVKMILGLHQRGACHDGEACEVRWVEPAETLSQMTRRTSHRLAKLIAQQTAFL